MKTIEELRTEQNMTLRELSMRSLVQIVKLSKIEQGLYTPTQTQKDNIAIALGIEAENINWCPTMFELRMVDTADGTISRSANIKVLIRDAEDMFADPEPYEIEVGDALEIVNKDTAEIVWTKKREA